MDKAVKEALKAKLKEYEQQLDHYERRTRHHGTLYMSAKNSAQSWANKIDAIKKALA